MALGLTHRSSLPGACSDKRLEVDGDLADLCRPYAQRVARAPDANSRSYRVSFAILYIYFEAAGHPAQKCSE